MTVRLVEEVDHRGEAVYLVPGDSGCLAWECIVEPVVGRFEDYWAISLELPDKAPLISSRSPNRSSMDENRQTSFGTTLVHLGVLIERRGLVI